MPWIREKDRLLARCLDEWYIVAFDEINDILGWRGASDRFWSQHPDKKLSNQLSPDTTLILSELSRRFPKLDGSSFLEIWRAIETWHTDKSDSRIPDNKTLERWLDEATMVANILGDDLTSKATRSDASKSNPAESPDENASAEKRPAAWFDHVTGGVLNAERLLKQKTRLQAEQRGGIRGTWYYPVDTVCEYCPECSAVIRKAIQENVSPPKRRRSKRKEKSSRRTDTDGNERKS